MAQFGKLADATVAMEERADRHPLIRLAELYRLADGEDRQRIRVRLEQFLSLFPDDPQFQQRLEQSFWDSIRRKAKENESGN